MFIDPKLAQDRLDDPSNILNSLFKQHKNGKIPCSPYEEVPGPIEVNSDVEDEPSTVNVEEYSTLDLEPSADLSPTILDQEDMDSAMLSILGLNPRRNLPETSSVVPYTRHGRVDGVKEMPDSTKELIGTLGKLGNQVEVAKAFNVVPSTVSNLSNGVSKKNPALLERVNQNIGKVVDKALEKLLSTVDSMDEHRISQLSIKDASIVASQMSKVVSNMNPDKNSSGSHSGAQLIIYAPQQFNETRYEVVELGS